MTPAAPAPPHRLHALCPYFAMFPPAFAKESILAHSKSEELILDPFSGRGTTLLEALLNDRHALAADINPVAYCVTAAKGSRPRVPRILDLIDRLEDGYNRAPLLRLEAARQALPAFFRRAFSPETLRQLLFLRGRLRWRDDPDERFVMALLLGHLHGESDRSESFCSNQMPHSISTKPAYSLKYWRENKLYPPRRDAFDLLHDRASYRLEQGVPKRSGHVLRCDVRKLGGRARRFRSKVALVVTSPPYLDTTRFEEDQWLRLWMLGGPPKVTYCAVSKDDRHDWARPYWSFLQAAWRGIAPLLRPSAVLVCRLGARGLDPRELRACFRATVESVWPTAQELSRSQLSKFPNRQTAILHPYSVGCRYEIDFTVWIPDPTPRPAPQSRVRRPCG